jgi:hypothetical protein
VTFTSEAQAQLQTLVSTNKLDFYSQQEDVVSLISEVLMLNPHSVHTLNKHKEGLYAIRLDNLEIVYGMDSSHELVSVLDITHNDINKP